MDTTNNPKQEAPMDYRKVVCWMQSMPSGEPGVPDFGPGWWWEDGAQFDGPFNTREEAVASYEKEHGR